MDPFLAPIAAAWFSGYTTVRSMVSKSSCGLMEVAHTTGRPSAFAVKASS